MKKFIFALLTSTALISSALANASNINVVNIQVMEFLGSSMDQKLPALYAWDENGNPSFFHSGYGFDKAITELNNSAVPQEIHKSSFDFIKGYLKNSGHWNTQKQMLVFAKFDESVGDCEPCKMAEKHLAQLPPSLERQYHVLTFNVTK